MKTEEAHLDRKPKHQRSFMKLAVVNIQNCVSATEEQPKRFLFLELFDNKLIFKETIWTQMMSCEEAADVIRDGHLLCKTFRFKQSF